MSDAELITEDASSTPPELAIVTRVIPHRVSRGCRGLGDKSKERLNSKVSHVSLTRMLPNVAGRPRRVEVEVLATFEGATSEDAAREFARLYRSGLTRSSQARCIADGQPPPTPPRWNSDTATFHLIV